MSANNPEQSLLEAMTGYVKRRNPAAMAVTGYREQSYITGYCETCADYGTLVTIWWVDRTGAPHWCRYEGDLGEFIRELTDSPDHRAALESVARFEDEEALEDAPHRNDIGWSASGHGI